MCLIHFCIDWTEEELCFANLLHQQDLLSNERGEVSLDICIKSKTLADSIALRLPPILLSFPYRIGSPSRAACRAPECFKCWGQNKLPWWSWKQVSGLRMHTLAPASFAVSHNRDLEKTLWEAPGCRPEQAACERMASFLTLFCPQPRPSTLLPSSLCKGSGLARL